MKQLPMWTALIALVALGLAKAIGVWTVLAFTGLGLVIGLLVQRYLLWGATILIEQILVRFLLDMVRHPEGRQYIGFKFNSRKEPETFVRAAIKTALMTALIKPVSITTDSLYSLYEITEEGRKFVRERGSK